jgi:hypothetical protein
VIVNMHGRTTIKKKSTVIRLQAVISRKHIRVGSVQVILSVSSSPNDIYASQLRQEPMVI